MEKDTSYMEAQKGFIEGNAFANYNHIVVEDIQKDYARTSLEIVPESGNLYGGVHGGALFTLADVSAGMTARTDGRLYVTQNAEAHFLRGAKEGKIYSVGKVLKRGKTTCLVQSTVYDSATDKELFIGIFTFFCTSE